jgi:hypothetical protein
VGKLYRLCDCGAEIYIDTTADACVCEACDDRNARVVFGLALAVRHVDMPLAITLARLGGADEKHFKGGA